MAPATFEVPGVMVIIVFVPRAPAGTVSVAVPSFVAMTPPLAPMLAEAEMPASFWDGLAVVLVLEQLAVRTAASNAKWLFITTSNVQRGAGGETAGSSPAEFEPVENSAE